MEKIITGTPGVQALTTVVGFNLLSFNRNTYSAFFFIRLKPWSERDSAEQKAPAILAHLGRELGKLPQGTAFAFAPPSIPGVGASGGVTFILQDRSGKDIPFLAQNTQKFIAAAQKRPELARVITTFLPDVPSYFVNVDRDKVLAQGVDIGQVYTTLQAYMGGLFVNYFNRFGRQWQVYVEAEGAVPFRHQAARAVLCAERGRRRPCRSERSPGWNREQDRSSPCATTSTGPRRSTRPRRRDTAPRRP